MTRRTLPARPFTAPDTVHFYTRPSQPATRYADDCMGKRIWLRNPGGRLLPTSCCNRRRHARNLLVKVYYDSTPLFCRDGTGCKKPSRRHRVTGRRLLREFLAGRSMLALARRYGQPRAEIERRIRRVPR